MYMPSYTRPLFPLTRFLHQNPPPLPADPVLLPSLPQPQSCSPPGVPYPSPVPVPLHSSLPLLSPSVDNYHSRRCDFRFRRFVLNFPFNLSPFLPFSSLDDSCPQCSLSLSTKRPGPIVGSRFHCQLAREGSDARIIGAHANFKPNNYRILDGRHVQVDERLNVRLEVATHLVPKHGAGRQGSGQEASIRGGL